MTMLVWSGGEQQLARKVRPDVEHGIGQNGDSIARLQVLVKTSRQAEDETYT